MKLVINLKLKPTAPQQRALQETLERCNAACNWLSEVAFRENTVKQFALHKLTYLQCKERFSLTSQAVVRCIAKVADAYKLKDADKTQRTFRKWAAQPYDDRIFRFGKGDTINLWTLDGRQTIAFECGEYQRNLIPFRKGEVDLMLIKGKWYASCVVDIDDAEPFAPTGGVLGVDLGIVQIATDSDGEQFSGDKIEAVRQKYHNLRKALQKKGTKSAKRHLKKISKNEANFRKNTNHVISKKLVDKAKGTFRSINLEELKGIREKVTVRKNQRAKHSGWAFFQLQQFVVYKAKRVGVSVQFVNPRYTSQSCSVCGHTERANRKSQSVFVCKQCSFSYNADKNAALNISLRAAVNPPIVAAVDPHGLWRGKLQAPSFRAG
jgi:putative transposase